MALYKSVFLIKIIIIINFTRSLCCWQSRSYCVVWNSRGQHANRDYIPDLEII